MTIPLWKDFSYKSHQTTGIEWMTHQEEDPNLPGGFLCDEMGLGKTIEILGLVMTRPVNRTLVLCPLSVVSQWRSLAKKCKLNVFVLSEEGYKWQSAKSKLYANRPNIYILHYDCAIRHTNLTDPFIWDRIVYDEAHRLINRTSRIHLRMKEISASVRWIVTATPVVNDLSDIKSLLLVLGHDVESLPRTRDELLPLIQQKALCRTVDELRPMLPELPQEESTHIHTIPFQNQEEQQFYRSIQGKIVERLNILMEEGSDQWAILKLLLLLRQISVHPQIYINARKKENKNYNRENWIGDSSKFAHLKNLIHNQSHHHHRWIIFCHFHDEMDILATTLSSMPRVKQVQIYSGGLTQAQRDEVIRNTHSPLSDEKTTDVLIVQLQSGSVGLNLQHFDRIVFLSPWWTAALMDQAVGRAVRIGQTKRVEVHHIRLEEEAVMNIDAIMISKVDTKREMCNWFLDNASRGSIELDEENDSIYDDNYNDEDVNTPNSQNNVSVDSENEDPI